MNDPYLIWLKSFVAGAVLASVVWSLLIGIAKCK